MYTCSSHSCNNYGERRQRCMRCQQTIPSYYVGKRISNEERIEADRIMNEEDSINWAKEYKADVKRLKISMVADN